ncbi:MAG: Release factor glutamine methyltransferase [Candidatus Accumulibacter regalis]|uniref:Release factor glutamine methyltransferase n=1 Tax=Accumulibacter regalis TaxID=522306 RepID=A0A011P0C8_ACCRE|nr:peptide chain release factor N(5)-glutamine methyltransferase [Accumulibacter sp.]EXI88418.1 MAG: Release factor glutamine methyltransferase [Candidatus Accumulibacter regalis]HRE71083.1 peptide chain release factor N(5)-glutamine methyltransferase [Accumulibacter sp.]
MTMTLNAAWRSASRRIDRLDARLLVEQVATCTHADLIAHSTRTLSADQLCRFEALVGRRASGEPLAYLLGSAEFYGREFVVTPAVLIPRPETELLVDLAIERLRSLPNARILDLGTGSGVLAVTLARLCPGALVTAVDLSPAALAVASGNAVGHAVEVSFLAGHWYTPLGESRFDLIVANPPYVAHADPHLQGDGLPYEPRIALTDGVVGGDGLACLREIIRGAVTHLRPAGWLLVEHGYNQAAAVRQLLGQQRFVEIGSWCDLAGIERVSGGRLD